MSSRDETLDKAAKAEALVQNPAFEQAFSDVEAAILRQWKDCPVRDVDGQHELKLMYKLLSDLRANLDRAISDGKLAALEIEQERSPRSFLGSRP